MPNKPNFVLIPDAAPPVSAAPKTALGRLWTKATTALDTLVGNATPPAETAPPPRPRLVFAVDATASREPAWAAARQVTDALVKALPGALDVALAVHGGARVHTFTAFTSDANTLRDKAAGVTCQAGATRLLPILSTTLKQSAIKVVIYIGDVFEENVTQGRSIADAMGAQGTKLVVLHDTTADPASRRDAEIFWDLAKRTGGCVIPFDATSPSRLRDILSAVAVYAVGGEKLLRQQQRQLPGAIALLEHLRR